MIPRLNYYKHRNVNQDIPLDAYADTVEDVTKAYDLSLDKRDDLLKAVDTIQANGKGLDYVRGVADKIKSSLSQLANGIQGNNRWDLADAGIRELTNKFRGDKVIQAIKISHDNHLKGEETKNELLKKGDAVNLADDYDEFTPMNPDGTVNIYSPEWQQKADYGAKAKELTKGLPTEIETILDKNQNLPGYLKVSKVQHAVRGAKDSMLPVAMREYAESSEGIQQEKLIRKSLKGKSEKEIQDAIYSAHKATVKDALDLTELDAYKSVSSPIADVLGNFDRQMTRQEDREDRADARLRYKTEEQGKLALEKERLKAELKRKGGKSEDNISILGTEPGLGFAGTGSVKNTRTDNVTTVKNPDHLKAFESTVTSITGKGENVWRNYKLHPDDEKGLDKDAEQIVGFKPKGVLAYNQHESAFNGAWSGKVIIRDKEGKDREVTALMQNRDNDLRELYSTTSEMGKAVFDLQNEDISKKGYGARQVRADSNLFPEAASKGVPITLDIIRTPKGIQVKPLVPNKKSKTGFSPITDLTAEDREALGLSGYKNTYTPEEIRNMADNIFSENIKPQILTKKTLETL